MYKCPGQEPLLRRGHDFMSRGFVVVRYPLALQWLAIGARRVIQCHGERFVLTRTGTGPFDFDVDEWKEK